MIWLLACAADLRPPDPDSADSADSAPPWVRPSLSLGTLHELGEGGFVRTRDGQPIQQFRSLGPQGGVMLTLDADFSELDRARLTPEGEDDGDPAVAWGRQAFYQAAAQPEGAVLRRFDTDLQLTSQTPLALGDDERFLDESLQLDGDLLRLVSEHRQDGLSWTTNMPPEEGLARGLHLRTLDPDLSLVDERALLAEEPFWGLGSSQLWDEAGVTVFAQRNLEDTDTWPEGESRGGRAVIALRFDRDLEFVWSSGPLSPAGRDAYWPTGSLQIDGTTFVSYTFRVPEDGPVLGPPHPDQGNLGLLVLDPDLNRVDDLVLTDISSQDLGAHGGAHRSHLALSEDGLWLSYDRDQQAWVQEIVLEGSAQ